MFGLKFGRGLSYIAPYVVKFPRISIGLSATSPQHPVPQNGIQKALLR
jgi:hypothetical protein